MAEGGVMEVIVYGPQGRIAPVVVGSLGAVSSLILLVSGAAFCTGRSFGRRTAIAASIGMVPVHLMGWLLGFVGVPGVLLGVAYPTILLFVLGARPGLGAPAHSGLGAHTERPRPSDHTKQRAVLTTA
jgi:hypothetical protein